jgi:hypothetical protein
VNFPGTPPLQRQRGVIFIVMMVILVMGSAAFLVSSLNSIAPQLERDRKTAEALAQAREALIGYSISVDLTLASPERPGDLPCPDTNNDGVAEPSCGSAGGSNQAQRLGRLPWKTLGLSDLRDGSGERLWYAVSNNFKKSTRTTCSSPGQPGCLNSDTIGTISVFASDGTQLNNGGGSNGAVAVIIAPGEVLTRQGGTQQDRSNAGINIATNYLDIATVGGNTEDNANFVDGSPSNGFIQGRVKDANGNILVNDQLLIITQDNIMQSIQRRVAAEVKRCFSDYAAYPQNNNRYPWATPITDLIGYQDQSGGYFGRVPDTPFVNTCQSSDGILCSQPIPIGGMSTTWQGDCNISSDSGWWLNWKEMVFYGVAKSFRPNDTNAPAFPSTCVTPGNCLNVNTTATPARFIVIVAGKKLSNPDQSLRNLNKSNAFYYLEGGNENADQSGGYTFIQSAPSATFNDTLVYQ